ncbi:MAG: tape measure protein, partial [Epulopiscium sp.]|nr:tape measure protein [Candidatus Epulonipiscium sp.]
MATIRTSIQMFNGMTPGLRSMTNALNTVISSFETMQRVSSNSIDTSSLQAARAELNRAEVAFNQIEESIRRADEQQNRFNNSMNQGTGIAKGLRNMLAGIGGIMGIQKIANISDEFALATARLNLMNDGLQTTKELQDKIYGMAQRTGASYLETAGTISKLGILAKKAFKGNDELLAFTDLVNKSFIGASSIEQSAAVYQLTQAMASGRLQGDEFRSIIENAPVLAQSIEKYMIEVEKARGSMKDWASDGLLTANVIKNALFYSADEIEARFATMPMTWGRVWNMVTNKILKASQPLL